MKFSALLLFVVAGCSSNVVVPDAGEQPVDSGVVVVVDAGMSFIPNHTFNVGTGTGDLIIDGTTMTLACNDEIRIKAGTYSNITIKNIDAGCLVMVRNDGLIELVGNNNDAVVLENLRNVTISGDGTATIERGFVVRDNSRRAMLLKHPINHFTLQYFAFKSIGDYGIYFDRQMPYDGTESSYAKNLKFLHIAGEGTSTLFQFDGNIDKDSTPILSGLIDGLEIAYLDYKNSPTVGGVAWLGAVVNYDIHDNVIQNINANNDNHNGIFLARGSGKLHHNRLSGHQGNLVRAWTFSLGQTPRDVLIYNNIVVNSRKYSGFEVQSFENYNSTQTTFANAKIFNNTCGTLNTNHDWVGVVVDVYNLHGGTAEVFNNLGFNFFPAPTNNNVANQQSSLVPTLSNNLYFVDAQAAGIVDEVEFRLTANSPAKQAGKASPFVVEDFYGAPRGAVPSVGAVE